MAHGEGSPSFEITRVIAVKRLLRGIEWLEAFSFANREGYIIVPWKGLITIGN